MILFRRGHPSQFRVSSVEIDVTLDLDPLNPARAERSHEQFATWRPPIEVFETEGELIVRAEIGGLAQSEVEVLVSGAALVIRGERSVARPTDNRRYHESRVRYGPFEADIRLPFPVAVESATANYIDGFLSVMLPRLAATKVTAKEYGPEVGALRGD